LEGLDYRSIALTNLVCIDRDIRTIRRGMDLRECRELGSLPIIWHAAWRHLIGRQAIATLQGYFGRIG